MVWVKKSVSFAGRFLLTSCLPFFLFIACIGSIGCSPLFSSASKAKADALMREQGIALQHRRVLREEAYQSGRLLIHKKGNPAQIKQGISQLKQAADEGHSEACAALGKIYLEGRQVRKNTQVAQRYLHQAAEKGSVEAAFNLGLLYLSGKGGIPRNESQGAHWIIWAADEGMAQAQAVLADLYREGRGVAVHDKRAASYYQKAAAQGYRAAQVALADLYHAGKGLPRSLEEAFHWYQQAALSGEVYAQAMLSVLYQQGRGVSSDLNQSVYWYKKASRYQGFLVAQYRIGCHFAEGVGLDQNWHEAHRWLLLAANKGFIPAQVRMGEIYYQGKGTMPSYSEALRWYHRAAIQKDSHAQYWVGMMLLEGEGIKSNKRQAVQWIRKAAYQGAREAQYQMGLFYFNGRGVPKNYARAYGWWKIALNGVTDVTPEEIETTVDDMDPELRDAAVQLEKKYQRQYSNRRN